MNDAAPRLDRKMPLESPVSPISGRSGPFEQPEVEMRRTIGAAALFVALLAAGCAEAAGPDRHSLLGRWRSEAVGGATIEMAISETGRAVTGAGRWVAGDSASAFSIGGANTGESVSLIFQFDTHPSLNFLGVFVDSDVLEGTIVGAGVPSQPARFNRVEED